jgi:outer membrane protein assembly factor BamB
VASPVFHDGVLYLVDDGGIFMSVNATDGSVLKRGRLKQGGRQFYASPVVADGKVFVVDTDGRLTVIQAGGADWQELSSTELGEPVVATPAICDGRLYVRTASKLYCFGQPRTP